MKNVPTETDRQQRLQNVIAEYLTALDAGEPINPSDWISRHHDLSPELSEFIQNQAEIDQLVRPVSGIVPRPTESHKGSYRDSETRRPTDTDDAWTAMRSREWATATNELEIPPEGTRLFGDYELIREVGKGGMGVVFEARQRSLNRTVAIKMLRLGALSTQEDFERLRNEAETAAALDHPTIVPIHEVGQQDGQPYFTMKLVKGDSLDQCLEQFQQDSHSAARLVCKLAEAVDHAHQRGVLHRDLKPANILLDEAGEPHITDYGLSRRIGSDSQLTQTGVIIGTPSYMAPEQTATESKAVTITTDVYGLGAILYSMLTGRPPFRGDSILTTIEQVRTVTPKSPSQFYPTVPKDLEAICLKCLEKHSDDRYVSAAGLADDLQRFLKDEPVSARPVGKMLRLRRWSRHHPALSALLSAFVLLISLLVVGSTATAIILADKNQDVLDSLQAEIEAKDAATKSERLALRTLYEARKQQARAEQFSGRPGQRVESLKAIQHAASLIPRLQLGQDEKLALRNEAIAAMQLIDLVPDETRTAPQGVGKTDWDVSRYLRMESDRRALRIHDIKTDRLLGRLTIQGAGSLGLSNFVKFSPGGKYVAAMIKRADRKRELQVWDVEQTAPILTVGPLKMENSSGYDFRQNDESLAVLLSDGTIRIHALASGEVLHTIPTKVSTGLNFAPKSNRLLTFGQSKIWIHDLESNRESVRMEAISGLGIARFSPDERYIAGGIYGKHELYLWNVDTGEQHMLSGHAGRVNGFCFHPGGNIIASSSLDDTTRLWSLADGKQLLWLNGKMTNFSRDGRWLGHVEGGKVGRWHVKLPREFLSISPKKITDKTTPRASTNDCKVAVHPEGRLMISGDAHTIQTWDLATMQPLLNASRPGGFAQFSPNGRRLFTAGINGREIFVQSVEKQQTDSETLYTIGPPRKLELAEPADSANTSANGRSFKSSFGTRAYQSWSKPVVDAGEFPVVGAGEFFVYDMDNLHLLRVQGTRRNGNFTAVGPNGKLLAVGHWRGPDTHVWDVRTHKLIKKIPSEEADVAFSPDGRILAVCEPQRCSFHDVKTWKLLYETAPYSLGHTPRPVVFSPDGSMVLFMTENRLKAKLLCTRDFAEIATIDLPTHRVAKRLAFSPDGSLIFECHRPRSPFNVWDLRKIRESLGTLDWDLPPFPEPKYDSAKPMRVLFAESENPPTEQWHSRN